MGGCGRAHGRQVGPRRACHCRLARPTSSTPHAARPQGGPLGRATETAHMGKRRCSCAIQLCVWGQARLPAHGLPPRQGGRGMERLGEKWPRVSQSAVLGAKWRSQDFQRAAALDWFGPVPHEAPAQRPAPLCFLSRRSARCPPPVGARLPRGRRKPQLAAPLACPASRFAGQLS